MSDAEAETRWPSALNAGLSVDWVERDGRFMGVDAGQGFQPFESLDIEQLRPVRQIDGNCTQADCPGPTFPSDFKACPTCGCKLAPMFGANEQLWSFPGPDGDGLLNAESIEILGVSDPIEGGVRSPDAADLIFVVGGSPPRLFAIDRVNSTVYVFNRQTRGWRSFTSVANFDDGLPRWAWSVVSFDNGLAFAGADGPLIVRLNRLGNALETVKPQPGVGTLVAGPGNLDGQILFLLVDKSGQVGVVTFNPASGAWSKSTTVSGALIEPGMAFAAPASKSPTMFWVGASGYVAARSVGGEIEAFWRPWSEGYVPECQIRPIWTQQSLWQFGTRGSDPQFEKLSLKGAQANCEVSATHLTAGECSFTSGMKLYVTPWDEGSSRTLGSGDSFLAPICGLKGLSALVADCGFDPAFRRFNPGELLQPNAPAWPARLLVQKAVGRPLDLKRSIKLSNLAQLQCVVFDGSLLVYDNKHGTIEAWKIK